MYQFLLSSFQRSIHLSILSPRKIPALFKLFEKAGGDLQSSQTKNYAKDPRHLVLLKNYNLKERPLSPSTIQGVGLNNANTTSSAQVPTSPLQSSDSPSQNPQSMNPTNQAQAANFRNQAPTSIASVHQPVVPPGAVMAAPMGTARPPFNNQQIPAPPNYHATGMPARPQHPRWMRPPFIPPGSAPQTNNTQGSALIAQLTQPPSALNAINVAPFAQRLDRELCFDYIAV